MLKLQLPKVRCVLHFDVPRDNLGVYGLRLQCLDCKGDASGPGSIPLPSKKSDSQVSVGSSRCPTLAYPHSRVAGGENEAVLLSPRWWKRRRTRETANRFRDLRGLLPTISYEVRGSLVRPMTCPLGRVCVVHSWMVVRCSPLSPPPLPS